MRLLMTLAALFAFSAVSTAHADDGDYYRVTGVSSGLWLNVRSGPGVIFPEVGRLDYNQRLISTFSTVQNGNSTWIQVSDGQTHGWVNQRFLRKERTLPWNDTRLHADLLCSGQTPAWGMKLDRDGTFQLALPSGTYLDVVFDGPGTVVTDVDADVTMFSGGTGAQPRILAAVSPGQCFSADNDAPQSHRVSLIYSEVGGQSQTFNGCCNIPALF